MAGLEPSNVPRCFKTTVRLKRLTNTGQGAEPGKGSGQWDRSDDWAVWIVLLLILALMDR